MSKIIFSILLVIMLPGCLPAAFVAGAAAGGAIIYDHRSTKKMVLDRDITFQIQNRIDRDAELHKKASISVTSFNGIVLLIGQAPTEQMRTQAEEIAKSNLSVKMVYNEITIEQPISNTVTANDAWITAKVKTVLLSTPGLNSTSLKIVTENGVVYLMGLTTRTHAELATEKTRTVAGVSKIVKLFEYLN